MRKKWVMKSVRLGAQQDSQGGGGEKGGREGRGDEPYSVANMLSDIISREQVRLDLSRHCAGMLSSGVASRAWGSLKFLEFAAQPLPS